MQRGQNAEHQCVAQLVHVQPLTEHAVLAQVAANPGVELSGKEAGYPADPWIGRLRHDEVVPAVLGGEVGLGIVDDYARARIVEGPAVDRIEYPRALDHLRLDLDGHELPQGRASQEEVGGHAGPLPDDGGRPCSGCMRQGHQGEQGLSRRHPPGAEQETLSSCTAGTRWA